MYAISLWCFCSVSKLCMTLCDPMNCSMLGFPVLHYFPEFAPTHVHWVNDAIQPFHLLLPPSSLAFSLSQHQGVFQWVNSLHQVAKISELQLQHQPFQWIFRVNLLKDWLIWSPCCLRESQESSPAPQFKSINCLVVSLLYGPTRLWSIQDYWKSHSFDQMDLCQKSDVSAILWGNLNIIMLCEKSQKSEICMFLCICFLEMQTNREWQKK